MLGFSIGGMVSQEIALQAPELVRKLILVGTGPRGADMSTSQSSPIFAGTYEPAEHLWLKVHFSPSEASQAAGLAFLERKLRRQDRDPLVGAADHRRAARGDRRVHRLPASRRLPRLSQDHPSADPGGARQQRRDHPDLQFLRAAADAAERAADPLSRTPTTGPSTNTPSCSSLRPRCSWTAKPSARPSRFHSHPLPETPNPSKGTSPWQT